MADLLLSRRQHQSQGDQTELFWFNAVLKVTLTMSLFLPHFSFSFKIGVISVSLLSLLGSKLSSRFVLTSALVLGTNTCICCYGFMNLTPSPSIRYNSVYCKLDLPHRLHVFEAETEIWFHIFFYYYLSFFIKIVTSYVHAYTFRPFHHI